MVLPEPRNECVLVGGVGGEFQCDDSNDEFVARPVKLIALPASITLFPVVVVGLKSLLVGVQVLYRDPSDLEFNP